MVGLAAADKVNNVHLVAILNPGFTIFAGFYGFVVDPDNQEFESVVLVLKQLCHGQAFFAGNLFGTVI